MARISSVNAVKEAQAGNLGAVDLPTAPAPEQEAASTGSLMGDIAAAGRAGGPASDPSQSLRAPATDAEGFTQDTLPEAPAQVTPEEELGGVLQEQQRQSVPNLRERWATVTPISPLHSATSTSSPDGGIARRATALASSIESQGIMPALSLAQGPAYGLAKEGASGDQIADAYVEEQEGNIRAAVNRIGAVDNTNPVHPTLDPELAVAGSIVTENAIFQLASGATLDDGTDIAFDPVEQAQNIDPEAEFKQEVASDKGVVPVAKQRGNEFIGQQIAQEYQRLKGAEVPSKLPPKEAAVLGDAFKTLWQKQNPNLAVVGWDKGNTNQKYIQLTSEGEDVLAAGKADRARLFPSKNVRPAKIPLREGELPGDIGENIVRKKQGSVGKTQQFGKEIREAMKNLAQVPNVVDGQRLAILYATALPILQNLQDPETINDWRATINNIGSDKRAQYHAKAAADPNLDPEVEAQNEIQKIGVKLAQAVQSIAQERGSANYLSYSVQGFQGRVTPQQTKFNPTTSKAVRFVTRNATPSIANPGSRVEYNLRQMYGNMLVEGGDSVLPEARELKLIGQTPQLRAWGNQLKEALDSSKESVEAVSAAIDAGTPLTDPNFPPIPQLNLDPDKDADLIAKIKNKGEDGPHYIDGLIDFANYMDARDARRPYPSYFNVYIDGKTNGLASNAIQMGNSEAARRTGVTRDGDVDYLDEGDIRDQLNQDLLDNIDTNGFDGEVSEYSSELNAVARAVFSHRQLNKDTTMTFGYGKEIDSFKGNVQETIDLLRTDPSQIKNARFRQEFEAGIDHALESDQDLAGTLMTMYAPALEGVMSPEALRVRSVMRSASMMFAATNGLMEIEGPSGMQLRFGRNQEIAESKQESRYEVTSEGKRETFYATTRESEGTSAAEKTYTQKDQFTGEEVRTKHSGQYAYGGSVVGPVQALDAATVARSASGKSWNRLKQASNGNPYVHTVYDAFKTDANGYDVVLEEVNKNWLDLSMEWSYLQATKEAVEKNMAEFNQAIKNRNPGDKLTANERVYMDYILKLSHNAEGKPSMGNYYTKIAKSGRIKELRKMEPFEGQKMLAGAMKKVGYDWTDPPVEPTVEQLKTFVDVINHQLQPIKRLNSAIEITNNKKKELRKEIMAKGYKTKSGRVIPLQYYAH